MFWSNKKEKKQEVYLETSSCQRNNFRLTKPSNTWVKISKDYLPVNDLSIDGLSFDSESLHEKDMITLSIRLNNSILIDAQAEVLHIKEKSCGCHFTDISYPDKEVINIFISKEQKLLQDLTLAT